jgi:hypothetical protein
MATRIIEYDRQWISHESYAFTRPGVATVYQTPITASGTAQQSAAFGASTRIVTIDSDVDVHVKFGSNPTATIGDLKVKAGLPSDFWVDPGHKVSVLAA